MCVFVWVYNRNTPAAFAPGAFDIFYACIRKYVYVCVCVCVCEMEVPWQTPAMCVLFILHGMCMSVCVCIYMHVCVYACAHLCVRICI